MWLQGMGTELGIVPLLQTIINHNQFDRYHRFLASVVSVSCRLLSRREALKGVAPLYIYEAFRRFTLQ